jgi:excisionase family DNA binding protein
MPTQPADEELLTPGGVAALLYVDRKTVTRWAEAGKLSSIRTPGGHRRYLKSEVMAIMSGLPVHPAVAQTSPTSAQSPTPGSTRSSVVLPAPRGPSGSARPTTQDAEQQATAAAVVAEAVAVALEAVAAEAAEEVLATATAVSHAAERAAEAAETARGAREFAAVAAAQSVARDAVRTATRVQIRADMAAAHARGSVTRVAEELLRSLEAGTMSDASDLAFLLAETVLAAAETTADETQRAAATVANAVSAAAGHMSRTVAAAEDRFADHVRDAAHALEHEATVTADHVARETGARAAGVAMAAREAAAALGRTAS